MIDFTLAAYGYLLDSLINKGYDFYTVNDWILKNPPKGVVLRHDVDRRAGNSLKTAVIEKEKGLRATYYFRVTRGSFVEDIVKEIAELGHEIGYHYEDLSESGGDIEKAFELFRMNLSRLRKTADIRTISMHGKPLSKHNNLDMWGGRNFAEFGLTGEAYLSVDYRGVYYFSDTGRTWKKNAAANFRDYAGGLTADGVETTSGLVEFINNNGPEKVIIMTHPERWNSGLAGFVFYLFRDKTINTLKRILSAMRKPGITAAGKHKP